VTITYAQCRVTGRLRVALPPDQAFRLFTPRGEDEWEPQWKPQFPTLDGPSCISTAAPSSN
jgi:hypothetical protein